MKVMLPVTKNLDCVALFVFPVEPMFIVSPRPSPSNWTVQCAQVQC